MDKRLKLDSFFKIFVNFLVRLIEAIERYLKPSEVLEEMDKTSISRNELILDVAVSQLGVKEVQGSGDNKIVVKYHEHASKDNDKGRPDIVPWCSSFMCYVVEQCVPMYRNPSNKPMVSTNSVRARSWLKWGVSSQEDPLPGDIVVYWRISRSGTRGHVGVFLGYTETGQILTLGGNQDNKVNVKEYSPSQFLGIRRSSKSRQFSVGDKKYLTELANAIISREFKPGVKSLI